MRMGMGTGMRMGLKMFRLLKGGLMEPNHGEARNVCMVRVDRLIWGSLRGSCDLYVMVFESIASLLHLQVLISN